MKEKENVKISLGTVICIFIIVLLVIALFAMWFYYNKKEDNTKNETVTNNVTNMLEENNTVVTTKEDASKPNITKPFSEGTYAYTTTILDYGIRIVESQYNFKFSNNQFTADIGGFIIKGDYKVLNDSELQCTLKSDMLKNDPDQHINYNTEEWTIVFDILNDKIKVKELNIPFEEAEICISLYNLLGEHQELVRFDEIIVGTWNTKSYIDDKTLKDNLSDIFGTSSQLGSYLKLLDNNRFEDYVYPVTEGDSHRKGTYTFDGINKLTLKYDDDSSYKVEVYIVDESNLLYEDGQNYLVLSK